ncbi:MAG TPA: MarR family transcriptional regulator [Candidatus Krumholzibacteria bacterium]|nr:MarR family transcriptional regulator [Candidatus Krumholzibacteria bacterium]
MERLDQNVADAIRILAQSVQDIGLRSCIDEACPTRLTRNQFLILNLLNANGAFPIGEIAGVLDISSPAASKNVDRLESLGLVRRLRRAADRRVHDVELLPAGAAIVARFVAVATARNEALLARFSEGEKTQLYDLLRRVVLMTLENEKNIDAICLQCWSRRGQECILRDRPDGCLHDRNH